jgi:hypothetical protein
MQIRPFVVDVAQATLDDLQDRVARNDGGMSGDRSCVERKRALLEDEAVSSVRDGPHWPAARGMNHG